MTRGRAAPGAQVQDVGRFGEGPYAASSLQVRGELAPVRVPPTVFDIAGTDESLAVHRGARDEIASQEPRSLGVDALPLRRPDRHQGGDGSDGFDVSAGGTLRLRRFRGFVVGLGFVATSASVRTDSAFLRVVRFGARRRRSDPPTLARFSMIRGESASFAARRMFPAAPFAWPSWSCATPRSFSASARRGAILSASRNAAIAS